MDDTLTITGEPDFGMGTPPAIPGLCEPRVWDRLVNVWGDDAEEAQLRIAAMNADRRKIPLTGVGVP